VSAEPQWPDWSNPHDKRKVTISLIVAVIGLVMLVVAMVVKNRTPGDSVELSLLGMLVLGLLMLISGAIFYGSYVPYKITIASAPSQAEIHLDGKTLGKTPLTAKLKTGTYTLEASKEGFETVEHAVYVSSKEVNIVNIQLRERLVLDLPVIDAVGTPAIPTSDLNLLVADVALIKSTLLLKPEEAASVPLLRDKVRLLGEENTAIRAELRDIKSQARWAIGLSATVLLTLLGLIVTVLMTK